jgi:glycosyltransferase involved in cell wall biosynthesis
MIGLRPSLLAVRVLAVGNMYPPHHLGGYELVWRSAVRHLRSLGHDVRVLTTDFRLPDPSEPEEEGVHRELQWWWRDHAFPPMSVREAARIERANARVLARHLDGVDVVTWWSMGGMSMSLLERVRGRGIPAVAFVHDDWLDYGPRVDAWLKLFTGPRRGRLAGLAQTLLRMPTSVDFDNAARYVFVSERTRRRALDAGRNPRDWGIAHSGIDPAYIDPRPEQPWQWRLLYVGRIDERKGIATVVDALAQLPEATLTIVGEGDPAAEQKLREQAGRLGVMDRIRLEGFRTRAELPAAYEAADVTIFPVIWEEPWGLVPLESMALGRPVIATGRGGSGEYLRNEDNALLYEAGDADTLAAAARRLADDPQLRARLVRGGSETAPRHTEAVFNEAVAAEVEAARR